MPRSRYIEPSMPCARQYSIERECACSILLTAGSEKLTFHLLYNSIGNSYIKNTCCNKNNGNVRELEFCSNCGTVLKETGEGLWCPKCRKLGGAKLEVDVKAVERDKMDSIYVVGESKNSVRRVSRTCPRCQNEEAYQWFSSISGELAGVRHERTVEHLRCARCAHSWSESH